VAHVNARLTPAGRLILCQRITAGRPPAHVAAEMGISRTTTDRWWARYGQHGQAGLVDRPSTATTTHGGCLQPSRLRSAGYAAPHKLGPARIAARVGRPASTVHRVLVRCSWPCGDRPRRSHPSRDLPGGPDRAAKEGSPTWSGAVL